MIFPRPRVLPFAIALTLVGIGIRTMDMVSLAVSGSVFTTVTPAAAESSKPADADTKTAASPAPVPTADPGAKTQLASAELPSGLPSHPPLTATDDSRDAADLLQSLAQKREELDARAQDLDQRQALLQAAENRINKKVDELSQMRSDLEKLLDLQKSKDDAQLASLVKIYENMKAKDAAAIFDNLELPVLVDVSARMKEAKLAPVLAAMSPERARLLTVKLAEHRRNMDGTVADAKAALGDTAPAAASEAAPAAAPDAAGAAPATDPAKK